MENEYQIYTMPDGILRPYGPDGTLIFYDGPLVFWLPNIDKNLLAVAIPEVGEDYWPLILCQLSVEKKESLLNNEITLRECVKKADKWFYLKDYFAEELLYKEIFSLEDEWIPGDVTLEPFSGVRF